MTAAVHVTVPPGEAEVAADALWQAGAAAIEERPGLLIAGTGDGEDPAALLAAVAGRWPAEAVPVDLDAALEAWRAHARAVTVGERLVVRPPWVVDPPPAAGPPGGAEGGPLAVALDGAVTRPAVGSGPGPLEVVIDPGRAFGHGAHPTTRLALAGLCDLVRGGERVLDVGCGSGVLAIAALALGAAQAVAVDVDPAARAATAANAARNGVADRLAVVDGLSAIDRRHATDLVVANMLLPDLSAVAPAVAAVTAPAGRVVVSGVLTGQRDRLLTAYGAAGLVPEVERDDEGWLGLTLRPA